MTTRRQRSGYAILLLLAASKLAAQDTADAHVAKGYDALKQDRYEMAVDEFRAALRLDPKLTTRARFPLAVALFEMKQPVEARREFEIVRHEIGDHPNVLYYLGRLDIVDQDFPAAIRNLTRAAAKPPFPDAAYYLGLAYFKHGDLAPAEKWLKLAVESNPRDSIAQYQLGLVYRKQGRETDASKTMALSSAIRQTDTDESAMRQTCARKLDEGPRDEARQFCDQLYDAGNADKLTALGTIYGQHGDPEAALKPLRRAAELAPQAAQTQYNLAFAYFQLNRFEDARAPLVRATERWPDVFPLNALYGAVLGKLGEDLPAYQVLRHARQLNAQDPGVIDMLCNVSLKLARKSEDARDYPAALRYFQEAAALRSTDPRPHRGMAEVYELMGRPGDAASERSRAEPN